MEITSRHLDIGGFEVLNLVTEFGFHAELLPSTSLYDAVAWLQSPRVTFGTPTFNSRVQTLQELLPILSSVVSNRHLEKFASILNAKIHVWVVKDDVLSSHYETAFRYGSTVNLLRIDSQFYPLITLPSSPKSFDKKERLLRDLVASLTEIQDNPSHATILRKKLHENFEELYQMDFDSAHALSMNVRELEPLFNQLKKQSREAPQPRPVRQSDSKRGPRLSRITPTALGPRARSMYNSHLNSLKTGLSYHGYFDNKVIREIAQYTWFFVEVKPNDLIPSAATHIFGAQASHIKIMFLKHIGLMDFDLSQLCYFHFSPTTILNLNDVKLPDWSLVQLPQALKSFSARGSNFNGDLSPMTSLTFLDLRDTSSHDWSFFRFPPNLKELHLQSSNFNGEMHTLEHLEIFDSRRIISVESSGSECCNGRYFEDGTKQDMPRFTKYWISYENATSFLKVEIYRQASSKNGVLYWWMSGKIYDRQNGESIGKLSLYYTKSNKKLPPTSGWKKLRDGEPPTPKLSGIGFDLPEKRRKVPDIPPDTTKVDVVLAPDLNVSQSDAKKMSIHSHAPSSVGTAPETSFAATLSLFDDSTNRETLPKRSPTSTIEQPPGSILIDSTTSLMKITQEYSKHIQSSLVNVAQVFAIHETNMEMFQTMVDDTFQSGKLRKSLEEQRKILKELIELNEVFAQNAKAVAKAAKTIAEDVVEFQSSKNELAALSTIHENPSPAAFAPPTQANSSPPLRYSPLTQSVQIPPTPIHQQFAANPSTPLSQPQQFAESRLQHKPKQPSLLSKSSGGSVPGAPPKMATHNSNVSLISHNTQPSMTHHSVASSVVSHQTPPVPPLPTHQSNVFLVGHNAQPTMIHRPSIVKSNISFVSRNSQTAMTQHNVPPSVSGRAAAPTHKSTISFLGSGPQPATIHRQAAPSMGHQSNISFMGHGRAPTLFTTAGSVVGHQASSVIQVGRPTTGIVVSRIPGVQHTRVSTATIGVRAPQIVRAKRRVRAVQPRSSQPTKKWCRVLRQTLARKGIEISSKPVAILPAGENVLVTQIHGRRACIERPLPAWISVVSSAGEQILKDLGSRTMIAE